MLPKKMKFHFLRMANFTVMLRITAVKFDRNEKFLPVGKRTSGIFLLAAYTWAFRPALTENDPLDHFPGVAGSLRIARIVFNTCSFFPLLFQNKTLQMV